MSHDTDAAAYASWWLIQRVLWGLVDKKILTHAEAVEMIQPGIAFYAEGNAENRSAAVMLEQVKTLHQKAAGLRSN